MRPKIKTWRITGYAQITVSVTRQYTERVWDASDEMTPEKASMLMEDWVHEAIRSGDYSDPDIDDSEIEIEVVKNPKRGGAK